MADLQMLLIGCAISSVIAFGSAWKVQDWRYGDRINEMVAESERLRTEASEAAREAERQAATRVLLERELSLERNRGVETVFETITEIEYVPVEVPANCPAWPNAEWLRVHNLAAAARLPDSP